MSRRFLSVRAVMLSLLSVAFPLLAGCGGSGPAAPSPSPFVGSWTGRIDSRRSIAFTVADNQLTSVTLSDQTLAIVPPFSPFLCRISLTLPSPVTLNGNMFAVQVRGMFGVTNLRGTFDSATTASGTFDAYATLAGNCADAAGTMGTVAAGQNQSAGTWTATKQ
jgi:hypothetical protein